MFQVKFETDNAAFDDDQTGSLVEECARVLADIVNKMRAGQLGGKCRDSNGNTIGEWLLR